MKSAKDYLADANATVPRIPAAQALPVHAAGDGIFIDVRDSAAIAKSGTIAGALRIPRGLIEFAADSASPMHNPALQKDAALYLVCGVGGQAALAGKTLQEMGYTNVTNIGGLSEWQEAGGPTEA
jgi:rhodanese-related sulfurtransferase